MTVRLRRALTAAETHMAVEEIDGILNEAKEQLQQAIETERARVVDQLLAGRRGRLVVTDRMRQVLLDLYLAGVDHAHREAESMGVSPGRGFAVDPLPRSARRAEDALVPLLGGMTVRVRREHQALAADLSSIGIQAVRRRLLALPGARDAAGRVISSAFTAGLGDVFEENEDLFDGWQYSAILDGGVCPVCRALDGTVYATWAEIQAVLPNGGPNPGCRGGGRCRCRALPVGAAGAAPPPPPPPPPPAPPSGGGLPPGPDDRFAAAVTRRQDELWATARRARRLTTAEHREQVDELVRTLARRSGVQVRAEARDLPAIARDGRLKSQFETGTSGGYLGPSHRADAERQMFGYPPGLDVDRRPIYGHLDDGSMGRRARVQHYGSVILGVRDTVRERTTLVFGDSLELRAVPTPVNGPSSASVDPEFHFDPLGEIAEIADVYPYAEAQIHGGLPLSDVEFVEIPERDWAALSPDDQQAIRDAADQFGFALSIFVP